MAIVRGASTNNEVNGATTVDLAVPTAAVGDVVLFVIGTSTTTAAGDADLTQATTVANVAGDSITVWHRVIDGTEPASYTFTGVSGRTSGAAVTYSGVDTGVVLDSAPGTDANNGTATTAASVTTSADGCLLFGVGLIDAASAADISPPPEQTQIWESTGTGRRTVVSDEILATAGAATRTWTQTSTLAMAVALVPLRDASAVGSPGSVRNLWVGAPTTDGATVAATFDGDAADVRLKVSTTADLLTAPTFGPLASVNGNKIAKMTVTGLTAGTDYFYGVEIDGVLDTATTGRFRTVPVGATDFTFVFGSCANGDSDAFPRALARTPDLCIINGDLHYADPGTAGEFYSGYDGSLATAMGDMLAAVPTVYTWSDHDWSSDNNAGAGSAMNATANAIYRERVPSYPLVEPTTGIYHTFAYGRVRFIVTDERSFKSDNAAVDDASKTMLGATQKQWLKDQITNATEPVIMWVGDAPWNGAASSPDDEWFAYDTERQELAAFFVASGKNVIRLGGDMHALAADDGTNSPGGIPVLQAAPWFNLFSNKGGPYTSGPYPTSGSSNIRQYGHVAVTDTGSAITVDFTGYDTTDVARVSWSDTYVTATTASGSAAGSMSLDGTATGSAPVVGAATGSTSGVLVLAGSATGVTAVAGSTSGMLVLDGSATGQTVAAGSTTGGVLTLSGTATGATPPLPPAVPVGNLPPDGFALSGWSQVAAEEFGTDCVEGTFLATYPGWFAYPDTWPNSPATSMYDGGNSVRVEHGIAKVRLHHDGTTARSEALEPPNTGARTSGVFEVCYRVRDSLPGFHQAFLLWPESDVWGEGEVDYPEADLSTGSTITAYVHERGATPEVNAYVADSGVEVVADEWHTARTVWAGDRLTFYLDGVQVGDYTSAVNVPDTAHRWVLQTEAGAVAPEPDVAGDLDIAYVAAWERIPVEQASGFTTGGLTLSGIAVGNAPGGVKRDLRILATEPPTAALTTLGPAKQLLGETPPTSVLTTGDPAAGWTLTEPDL